MDGDSADTDLNTDPRLSAPQPAEPAPVADVIVVDSRECHLLSLLPPVATPVLVLCYMHK